MTRMLAVLIMVIIAAASLMAQATDFLSGMTAGGTSASPEGEKATIRVANANVRYGPDKDRYRIVVTMQKGETVTVYERKGEWLAIAFPATGSCWAYSDFVELLGNDGTVTGDDVVIREDARLDATVIGKLNKGDTVSVAGIQGKWYRLVPPSSLRAYIHTDLVDLPTAETRQESEYVRGQVQNFLLETGWQKSPEGKQLIDLDRQIWVCKSSVKLNSSTVDELKKTRQDVTDLKGKIGEVQAASANPAVQERAGVLTNKADKVVEYIDAVIRFLENYILVEQSWKTAIDRLKNQPASIVPFSGCVDDVGRYVGRKSPYVLRKGSEIIAYLKAAEILDENKRPVPVIDLKKFFHKEVDITLYKAAKRRDPREIPLLVVEDLVEKGSLAW